MTRQFCAALPEALDRAMAGGVPYVILDGKVFAGDRCSEPATSVNGEQIDAWYSGKAHHAMDDPQTGRRLTDRSGFTLRRVAMRHSQVRIEARSPKPPMPGHAASIVSWSTSSAAEPGIR